MQKNRKHTNNQMYDLIRNWEASGLTQAQFFLQHGITKSTFGYWRKKYLKEFGQESKKDKFIPIQISDQDNGYPNTKPIELVYPNGIRLVCSADMDLSRLKPLIIL